MQNSRITPADSTDSGPGHAAYVRVLHRWRAARSKVGESAALRNPLAAVMAGRPYRDVHSDLTRLVSTHPFTLGRLVWLASLKDPENGRYQYSGWVDRLGTDDIDRMLRTSHQQAFAGWLSCTLEHQTSDFVEYLSSLDGTQRTGFCALEWLKSLPPESARAADRELFVCDLRLVIGLAEG